MKRKWLWLLISCLMATALVLASCGPTEEEEEEVGEEEEMVEEEEEVAEEEEEEVSSNEPQYGGVLRCVHDQDPRGFDDAFSIGSQYLSLALCSEELFVGDWTKGPAGTGDTGWAYGGGFILMERYEMGGGGLAESWEIDAENNAIIFHIRQGVHFHNKPPTNGREMTADDVVFNIDRQYTNPPAFLRNVKPHPTSIEATDKWTVAVEYASFYDMTQCVITVGDLVRIHPRDAIEYYGDLRDWRNAIGTGPFMLTDYVKGSSLTVVRNPDYWDTDPIGPGKGNQLPYLDGVKILIIPDVSTRLAAIRTAKADESLVPWEEAQSLRQTNPELLSSEAPDIIGYGIVPRGDNPDFPWSDKRVRHALFMAVDLQTIVDDYYGGQANWYWYPSPGSVEYAEVQLPFDELPESVQELYDYNPDKAKQLLEDAGYGDGFDMEVMCMTKDIDLMSIYKDYYSDIGVNMIIDPKETAVYNSTRQTLQYTQAIFGTCTPHIFFFNQTRDPATNARNLSRVKNELFDEAYKEVWAAYGDYEEQARIFKEITPDIIDEAWWLPVPATYEYNFWQPWLKNYHGEVSVGNSNRFNFARWVWIDQDMKEEMTGQR